MRLASSRGLRFDPVEQRTDVFVRIFAQKSVIEFQKRLAKAGRAADVRINNRHAQLIQIVIAAAEEAWSRLAFRSTVNVDDDGTRSSKFRRRHV